MVASADFPDHAARRGRVEPVPRRVRGYCAGELIFDTTAARYVWELPYYPQYYIPLDDVRSDRLVDESHPQRSQFGPFRLNAISAGGTTVRSAARVFDSGGDGLIPGYVRFEWHSLDWFEEDERVLGHPRNPYTRVDALRSHRHVVVELGGNVLADTHCPVLLFETGLPTRYYIDRSDVDFTHLTAVQTQSLCPYKGTTTGYWSVLADGAVHADLAWSYDYPLPAVAPIAGLIAFYNEKVDITVDGIRIPRPTTHFS